MAPAVVAAVGEAEDLAEAAIAAVASADLAAAQVVEAAHPAVGNTHVIAFT